MLVNNVCLLISVNNTIKCTKFTFNLINLWYFWRPKWNKCDEIKCTLYNFYKNFLETLVFILHYQTVIFSSFILLLWSVSIKLYFRRKLSLSMLEIDEHNDFIHFSHNSLNVLFLAFSPIKTSITIYFSIVNTTCH